MPLSQFPKIPQITVDDWINSKLWVDRRILFEDAYNVIGVWNHKLYVILFKPKYFHWDHTAYSYYGLNLNWGWHLHWHVLLLLLLWGVWYKLICFNNQLNYDIRYAILTKKKVLDEYSMKIYMVQGIKIKDAEKGGDWWREHINDYFESLKFHKC